MSLTSTDKEEVNIFTYIQLKSCFIIFSIFSFLHFKLNKYLKKIDNSTAKLDESKMELYLN